MGMGLIADRDLADAVDALGDGYIMRVPAGCHTVQMQHCCIEVGSGASNARPVQRYKQQGRSPPRGPQQGRSRSPLRGRYDDLGEEDL